MNTDWIWEVDDNSLLVAAFCGWLDYCVGLCGWICTSSSPSETFTLRMWVTKWNKWMNADGNTCGPIANIWWERIGRRRRRRRWWKYTKQKLSLRFNSAKISRRAPNSHFCPNCTTNLCSKWATKPARRKNARKTNHPAPPRLSIPNALSVVASHELLSFGLIG